MYKWVNEVVPEAALKKVDVDIGDLIAQKGVHYGSGLAYLSAKVENEDGKKENYDFVIKYGLTEAGIRRKIRADILFEREIQIYTKLLPKFLKLEVENGVEPIKFTPKCYKAEVRDNQEIMILEDLTKQGYVLWNKAIPMTLNHIKIILSCYGKWHALSYALQDQKRDDFEEIVGYCAQNHPFGELMEGHIGDWINLAHKTVLDIMEEEGEADLLAKYKEKIGVADPKAYFKRLFSASVEQAVVVHGDCSCNNFMFKYDEKSDPDHQYAPQQVKILDFQACHLNSPVFDLSFLIYTVSSEDQLEFIREMLEGYYTAFATHLTKLGSDPKKLFTFADLVQHWEKYSATGALLQPFVLALCLSSEEQTPDVGKEEDFRKWLAVTKTDEYRLRALTVARNFVCFEFM